VLRASKKRGLVMSPTWLRAGHQPSMMSLWADPVLAAVRKWVCQSGADTAQCAAQIWHKRAQISHKRVETALTGSDGEGRKVSFLQFGQICRMEHRLLFKAGDMEDGNVVEDGESEAADSTINQSEHPEDTRRGTPCSYYPESRASPSTSME